MTDCQPCEAKRQEILRKYRNGEYSGAIRAAVEGMLMLAGLIEKRAPDDAAKDT